MNMRTRYFVRSACALTLAASILGGASSASAALYSLIDLGVLTDLPSRNDSKPNAISSNGKVAAANVTGGVYRAFLYDASWTNLGTLGGTNSFALGVSESAAVVGRSLVSNGLTRAFLWTPNGTDGVESNPQMKDLGTFAGGMHSEAAGINNAGLITGYAQTATRDHAFRYGAGAMTDIGALLPANLPNSYGLGINEAGHIVGIAYDVFFTFPHAFYYNGSTASDIGNLNMPAASALAINNNDQIAGYASLTNFFVHAFRYADGVMHDLGTLGGHYSYAIAINNSNVIVGGSFTDPADSIYHAFITVSNSMVDLNGQLDATGNGWTLAEARGINDAGQIVGTGQFNSVVHAFLLNPAPEITGIRISGADVLISFSTVNAARYAVASRNDLAGGDWSNLAAGIEGTGGIVTITDAGAANQAKRFYRVSLQSP